MQSSSTSARTNHLLASIPEHEWRRLLPSLRQVHFAHGEVLYEAGAPVERIYFPTTAVISCVVTLASGGAIEGAVVGLEGAAGVHAAYGIPRAAWRHVTQMPGDAWTITLADLAAALPETPALEARLFRHSYLTQQLAAQSIACNRFHPVVERLARWLLMVLDRTEGNRLPMTHEFLGLMLGAHRPTVTLALRQLTRAGLIEPAHRGQVIVLDRTGLEDAACECYAAIALAVQSMHEPATSPALELTGAGAD